MTLYSASTWVRHFSNQLTNFNNNAKELLLNFRERKMTSLDLLDILRATVIKLLECMNMKTSKVGKLPKTTTSMSAEFN
jgi:hypothetical protein